MNNVTICHVSDNHGHLLKLPTEDFELLVCTGDFFPSAPWRATFAGRYAVPPGHKAEIAIQKEWLENIKDRLLEWIGDRPFVWCPGNHDFVNPCPKLEQWGVKVYDCDRQWQKIAGLTWYGLPFINYIEGYWNYERTPEQMYDDVKSFMSEAEQHGMPDVLLAHCPLHGILDRTRDGIKCGNGHLLSSLLYRELGLPKYYLCGHIHESHGTAELNGMQVWNSATIAQIIELKLA